MRNDIKSITKGKKSKDVDISLPEGTIRLSPRQWEILEYLKAGKANKEIAYELGIGIGTVKQHMVALFKKMGVTNRAMAVAKGMSAKIGSIENPTNSLITTNPFSEHPDKIVERRPAVVLSLQLTSPMGEADGELKKDYYKIFTCVAFDFDAVFLRQSDLRCEMIFGIRSIRHHDVLRAVRAAVAVSEDIRSQLKPRKPLRGGVSFGTLIASMDRRGNWTGESISGSVVASARKLCSLASDDTLRLDLPSRHMISFLGAEAPGLGAEVPGMIPESIPLRSTFSWTRSPLPTPASFIGRSGEIKTFETHIGKLKKGTGGLLLVEGESGMGKSSLLRCFTDICSTNNIDCHTWVSPHPDSQPAAPSLGHLIKPSTNKMESVDDICDELIGKHLGKPTVVMIDDYHLQPPSCIETLRHAIEKLDAAILFVLAGRGQLSLLDFSGSDATVLNPGRFSNIELKKIIKDTLDENDPATTRIVSLAAGVPVFAVEMADEVSRLSSSLSQDISKPTLSLFSLVMERVCKIGIDRHLL